MGDFWAPVLKDLIFLRNIDGFGGLIPSEMLKFW